MSIYLWTPWTRIAYFELNEKNCIWYCLQYMSNRGFGRILLSSRYNFLISSLMSTTKGDGHTDKIFPEVQYDPRYSHLSDFKPMPFDTSIVGRHALMSVFRKRGDSVYTRLQRLSVFFVLLFMLMACSAMWYRYTIKPLYVFFSSVDYVSYSLGIYRMVMLFIRLSGVFILQSIA
jgi:hypothetical protein